MNSRIIIMISAIMVSAAILAGCGQNRMPGDAGKHEKISEIEKMPQISGQYIDGTEVDGEIWSENQFTLVNVWATGCGPCIEELPALQVISDKYGEKEVGVLGILADGESAQVDACLLLREENITYPNVIPDQEFIDVFISKENAVPYSLIVDREGNIVYFVMGAQSQQVFEQKIDELLENTVEDNGSGKKGA